MLTIPTKGNPRSLYQMLLYYFEVKKENANISFINRLDYETQGLILVAKNRNVAYLFNSHKKRYNKDVLCVL
ncbi:MAG: pseudouridine synthase [Clostridium sp.]|nr:MAG: pseudouridine synthase [Clostridium sp.]